MNSIPSMLSQGDREAIRKYANNKQRIVELGCWLGASTQEILDVCHESAQMWTHDKFIWEEYMNGRGIELKAGASFGHLFKVMDHRLGVMDVDIRNKKEWPSGLDFIYADALKDWFTTANVFKTLLPNLRKGGIIMDQDFFYSSIFSVHSLMHFYAHSSQLRLIDMMGHTAVFEMTVDRFRYNELPIRVSVSSLSDCMRYWANKVGNYFPE